MVRFVVLKNIIFIRELVPFLAMKAERRDVIIGKELESKPLGVITCI